MFGAPGLTVTAFFRSLSEQALRGFFESSVLSVIDAMFGGHVSNDDLLPIALKIVDLGTMLRDRAWRNHVVGLVPEDKRAELDSRIGRPVSAISAEQWTEAEVGRLCEFFGLLDEDHTGYFGEPVDTEVVPRYGLFPHQRTAVGKLSKMLNEDERRAVLHLPTGVGKTRTAMHVVAESLRAEEPSVVVWLASGRELLEQAVAAFREAWMSLGTRPLQVGAMQGDQTPALDDFVDGFLAVGIAKGWALSRTEPDWALRLSRRVRLVVFDEAHQAVARTYKRVADELTLDYRCALLGLTATPGRTWADIDADGKLSEYFSGNKVTIDVPGDNPIEFLINNGFLARPTFRTLLARPGLDVSDRDEIDRISALTEIPAEIVAALSMSEQYVAAVLSAIEQLLSTGHRRLLAFAASVTHARLLTAILVARGVRSETVTATTSARVRDRAIRMFKSDEGTPMVLVNFGVLTTGFDAPGASAAVIARPTKSLVLYSQMVGRVIRGPKAGGTEACEIVTVVDPSLPGFGDVADAFLNWEDVW